MLGRPNLARYHCQDFRIAFHLNLSEELSSAALQGSYEFEDTSGRSGAIYGKTYKSDQQPHVVDGIVINAGNSDHHFSFNIQLQDRGRPPADITSPDVLWNLAVDAAPASQVDVSFYGEYRYVSGDEGDKWTSNLGLPYELKSPLSLPRLSSFTHLVGARFSNFEGEEVADSIEVKIGIGGEITHTVRLERKQTIDAKLIKRLFREGTRTSLALVTKGEGTMPNEST